ncbi:hypothetical protein KFK09_016683 [Dendrobium nobile]|uniref:Uncharacterized protein n=1 Tax=Dendrobium nobile TaxID=94219 RepID=A0A8T3B0P7_DENNO|nr:hypothetical protein KFK09_016683 [Dendrobium nobile]
MSQPNIVSISSETSNNEKNASAKFVRLSGPRCPRPSMKPGIRSSRYAADPAARRDSTAAMVTVAARLADGKEDR